MDLANNLQPDVVIMDIAMPQLNGVEATRQITRETPGVKVLILSSYDDDEYLQQLTEAGARGYLVKQTAAADVVKAVHEVWRGDSSFSPSISKRLLDHCREAFIQGKQPHEHINTLTAREAQVLQLIAEGRANKQIAGDLSISIKTVEKHRQQLMNKLNIHDIAGLTRYALQKGIIESSSRVQA
jgi:DNA-binding NarL/FixJ family response regulator